MTEQLVKMDAAVAGSGAAAGPGTAVSLPDFLQDEEGIDSLSADSSSFGSPSSVSFSDSSFSSSVFDPVLHIAVCDHRTDKRYKNQSRPWSYLRDRNRTPIRTTETVAEYPRLPKARRDVLKDQGGFVGGWLREGVRKNGNVIGRQVAALDADCISSGTDFIARVRAALQGFTWFLYSTHKHTAEAPRYRLVLLLDREVSEEEYPPMLRKIAESIGMDFFDDSTYQANRMMYWASCPSDGDFVFEESSGQPLSADWYLAKYDNWRDATQWPTSSRQSEAVRKAVSSQQDPLLKEGLVGVFCREYFPIQLAMENFLSDVYAPTAAPNRWDYIPADATAGVVIYDDRFAYSHHATDPAGERLLNAFDLVRIHKFGDEDEKESFRLMSEFALSQEAVRLRLAQEKEEQASEEFASGVGYAPEDWRKRLRYSRNGTLENSVWNLELILRNDPDFAHFGLNEMAGRVQITGVVPWARPAGNDFWTDGDTAHLKSILDNRYAVFNTRHHDIAFANVTGDRGFHPVRDYLNALPTWDGECRLETLLIRCFQAPDTPYIRAVTRKTFAAAVARAYAPGIKFDSLLVLDGAQGIGKSTLFRQMAGDAWFQDTLSLTDMSDKSAAEKIQGIWIAEIGELAGMRKADIEKVKAFLSTADDKYRPSYGHVVESHPRQGIMVATVNGDNGYLRDISGNRRFWIVKCGQQERRRLWSLSPEERDQLWAEAKYFYTSGEKLYLEPEYQQEAEAMQTEALELDERQGMVETYLETLLPEDWDTMDLYNRRNYLDQQESLTQPRGQVRRTRVCNLEIWAECFGKDVGDLKPADSRAITAIMERIRGWGKTGARANFALYGQQRVYERTDPDFLS